MKIVFLEKGFEIPLDSSEIEYTRTNSLFSALIGEWTYPFTLKATSEILAQLNYPHLPNILSSQEKTYKVQLYDGSFLHAQGDFVLQYADDEIITATLTATPGNISKKIWTKKLNTFNLGQDIIPTQTINNTVYSIDTIAKNGTYQYYILTNESGIASINEAVRFIFFDTRVEIKIGTTVYIDKTFKPTNEQRRAGTTSIFNSILEEFNNSQSNHEILYDEKQLVAIFTGNLTNNLSIKFTFYKLDTTEVQTVFSFSLTPQAVSAITNYLDESLANTWTKPYFFPEVLNQKHYTASAGFNGIINKTENGQIKRNINLLTEKTKYSLIPMFKLKWFIQKVFGDLGYTVTGDFLADSDIQKLLIFNLQTTDKLLPNVFYPINIHDTVITYAKHLPAVSLGEYIQAIIDEFGLSFEFNILTQTLDISFFNSISENSDILDLNGRMSRKRRNNLIKNKKTQLKWTLSGDNLAKDDTAPYLPVPLNSVVEENPDDYQSTELKIPGLTINTGSSIPQIEASCISPLFSQTNNSSPLRLVCWDASKGTTETQTLSFDLTNTTKGIFKKYLQNKTNFLNNAFNIEAGALLSKAEVISFQFRRKIFAFGVLWFAEELAIKLKAEQTKYYAELKLKRINSYNIIPGIATLVLSSNPANIIEGVSTTLTVSGHNNGATIIWYKNGVILSSGTEVSIIIVSPVLGDIYSAKQRIGEAYSEFSNQKQVGSVSDIPAPVLSSDPINIIEGISTTLTVSGHNNGATIIWYKNGVILSSGTEVSIIIVSPVLGDIYSAKQRVGEVYSYFSNQKQVGSTSGIINQVALITMPQAQLREQISITQIEGFDFPTKPNGEPLWQANYVGMYRNQIGRENLFRLGFSSVSKGNMYEGIEIHPSSGVSTLSRWQRFIWRNLTEVMGALHTNDHGAPSSYVNSLPDNQKKYASTYWQMMDFYEGGGGLNYKDSFAAYMSVWATYAFGDALPNGKPNIAGIYLDWEDDFHDDYMQDFVNRTFAMHYYMKQGLSAGSKYGIMYNNMPFKAFKVESSWYGQSPKNPCWTWSVEHTPNSIEKNMPSEWVGMKLPDLGDDLLVFAEAYYNYEDFLPEGAVVVLPEGVDGGTHQTVTHFGVSNNGWYKHVFAYLGFLIEINKPHIGNRKFILELCNFNGAGDGYYEYWNPTKTNPNTGELGYFDKPLIASPGFWEEAPFYMVEGQVLLCIFCGVWYNVWYVDDFGSDNTGPEMNTPIPTSQPKGTLINKNTIEEWWTRARDFSSLAGYTIAVKRFANSIVRPNGIDDTLHSIMDGNEKYLMLDTEVDYQDGLGFRKIKASMWKDNTLSPVRVIVNETRQEIAIWAVRSYINSSEPTTFKVRYNQNGFNFVSPLLSIREQTNELWKFKM